MNQRNWLICIGVALCCAAIYGQTLAHGFVSYDDGLYVTDNAEVQAGLNRANVVWAFTTERAMYMHPLTWLSHMLDCQVYGLKSWGHHLTNLVLHTLNSILLFLVLTRMTRRTWPSALVAALFAVHPLHVESVAWVAERKDVLSMLFWTAGMGAYAWHRSRPGFRRYLAVAVLFLLGFMSKPMVVTFPFVLLLLDYWPLDQADRTAPFGGTLGRMTRLTVEKVPLFLMTAAMCTVTMIMQMRGRNLAFGENVPLASRCANAAVVYTLYLVKTVWPSGLAVYYPHPITRPAWQVAGAAIVLVAVTLVCLREMRRRPFLLVGWLWYLGTLVPVIEIVQAGTFSHADRYTYIPLVGIFIMAAFGLDELCSAGLVPAKAAALAGILAVAALTVAAVHQTACWKDSETLFRHALAVTPDNTFSQTDLAVGLYEKGKMAEALEHCQRAVQLAPGNNVAIERTAMILHEEGRYAEALAKHREALALQPDDAKTRNNLRRTLKALGQLDAIEDECRQLEQNPAKTVEQYCRLGALAMALGNNEASFRAYGAALQMEPGGTKVHISIADALSKEENYADALTYYEKALQADPKDVHTLYNAGLMLAKMKQPDKAAEKYREALKWNPDFAQAHNNLANLLANGRRLEEAVGHYRRAIDLDPNYAQPRVNLASVLAFQGYADEAVALYEQAVKITPEAVGVRLSLARLLIENHRSAEAETHLKKALETDPNNADAQKLMKETGADKSSPPTPENRAP